MQGVVAEDMRGPILNQFEEANTVHCSLETSFQARERQGGNQNSGPGLVMTTRYSEGGPNLDLGPDNLQKDGLSRRLGGDGERSSNLDLVDKTRSAGDSVFRTEGINLEVVLVGSSTNEGISSTMPETLDRRASTDEGVCGFKKETMKRRLLEVASLRHLTKRQILRLRRLCGSLDGSLSQGLPGIGYLMKSGGALQQCEKVSSRAFDDIDVVDCGGVLSARESSEADLGEVGFLGFQVERVLKHSCCYLTLMLFLYQMLVLLSFGDADFDGKQVLLRLRKLVARVFGDKEVMHFAGGFE
ncbi:hypothetical protein Dimus_016656 [Dionaea muscipula]